MYNREVSIFRCRVNVFLDWNCHNVSWDFVQILKEFDDIKRWASQFWELICYKKNRKLQHACQKTNVLSNECPEGYLLPLPDGSLLKTHTHTLTHMEIQMTWSFWVTLSTLKCLLWIRNFHQSFGDAQTRPYTPNLTLESSLSLSLLPVFLFQTHSRLLSLKIQILCSLSWMNGQLLQRERGCIQHDLQ